MDDSGKFSPSSPPVSAKVSRRAIITKSTKDSGKVEFTTEDQWFSKERLYKVILQKVKFNPEGNSKRPPTRKQVNPKIGQSLEFDTRSTSQIPN